MSSELEILARWRTIGSRHSEDVIELGKRVLRGNVGDQEWSIREQLAIAALDMGQNELAKEQITILHRKFPSSPRVRILDGLLLESRGEVEQAKSTYEGLLRVDETDVSAHQRIISLNLSSSSPSSAIPPLLKYLDTFYSDPSGWSILSELYCELAMYVQALDAIGHLLVIQPWDESAVRKAGEVAYTLGDYQLSLKHFLRAAEMEGDKETNPKPTRTRTWWGIKLATSRLLESNSNSIESSVPQEFRSSQKQLLLLDQLATERILSVGGKGSDLKRKVLGESSVVR
ncbi:uncharacterized protein IL334_007699 [Kwoniella shivajii]|uniref:ER membrane protein complex subunit 2 n=1 Tax=Kwoniella shivajii TaxID=564305 RepID=A0ABZ1DCI6_9TREE|nr:hypothetical protein IL334_007699 [Kwoniella shivajii]